MNGQIVIRTPRDGFSVRIRRRGAAVSLALLATVVLAGLASVCLADDLSFSAALRTLSGHGTAGDQFLLYTLRMPRMLCAIAVGLGLGASGAIFQSLSRNPLGSPDIIGFTMGSSVGAVIAITVFQAAMTGIVLGSLAGGFAAAAAVYLLAFSRGVGGYRLVLVGAAISLLLSAVVNYLLTRVNLDQATTAQIWLTGSLNGVGWSQFWLAAIALAILVPAAALVTRSLDLLQLGDETARSLGVRAETVRLAALVIGTALAAVATATAGPVSFVALAAPQIARRLTGGSGAGPASAALAGALIVVAADWTAQYATSVELPVGVATGTVGGLYLAWLLGRGSGRAPRSRPLIRKGRHGR